MAMYNGFGDGIVAADMDALSRRISEPQQMVADNGYIAAGEDAATVGVASLG